ncbi:MAG: putative PurR-regulated permease PerM [Marivirga sp.]|jgi:predicted PurR-regulated permease PerM
MSQISRKRNGSTLRVLQYVVFSILILYWGRALFIPLSLALLISFVLYPFCNWLESHKVARFSAISVGLLMLLLLLSSVLWLLAHQLSMFLQELPVFKLKLSQLRLQLDADISNSWVNALFDKEEGLIGSVLAYIRVHVIPDLPNTLYQASISLVLAVLIPIYAGLILFYREVLVSFLYHIFPKSAERYIHEILPDVIITYYNFIKGMGLVYIIVGLLNSLGLFLLGVPNPLLFGFVASILTFVPYIGITIGALLPITISFIKYDSLFQPIGIIVVFVIVQILEANIIFPLAVSNMLKVNALVTLIVIIAGGILWGAAGMVIFLPFLAILKLIADRVEALKPVAILLGTREEL